MNMWVWPEKSGPVSVLYRDRTATLQPHPFWTWWTGWVLLCCAEDDEQEIADTSSFRETQAPWWIL